MNKVMLMYPPGKLYQRGEDRAQCNIEDSSAGAIHACNDLGYCAAILKKEHYELFLHDYQMRSASTEDMQRDILSFAPDVIFMSTTSATIFDDLKIIKEIKTYCNCLFVLKAALFYDVNLESLDNVPPESISCLIGGEVEFVIADVMNCILRGQGELSAIPGIVYYEQGAWHKTDFGCWQQDLDSLPFPDRSMMDNAVYVRPDTGEPMATVSVARGCPSRCIYCLTPVISGKKVRFRSTDNVMAELEECYHTYGIKSFFFKADTFTINRKWVMELCDKIIASDLSGHIAFTANARADTVSSELLKKMKQAGCFTIGMGFESGSDETLKAIKKGTTVADNLRAAKMIKKAGIPLFGFFMIGFPWETREDIQKTIDFIFDINPDFIEVSIAMPYYGTELFDICQNSGVITADSFGHDYYINPNTGGTQYVPLEELFRYRKKALLRFYLRPKYIFKKMLGAVRQPKVIISYIRHGCKLLKKTVFRKA